MISYLPPEDRVKVLILLLIASRIYSGEFQSPRANILLCRHQEHVSWRLRKAFFRVSISLSDSEILHELFKYACAKYIRKTLQIWFLTLWTVLVKRMANDVAFKFLCNSLAIAVHLLCQWLTNWFHNTKEHY